MAIPGLTYLNKQVSGFIAYLPPSMQLSIGIRAKLFVGKLNYLEGRCLESVKVKEKFP
jgi:hypothetical protein